MAELRRITRDHWHHARGTRFELFERSCSDSAAIPLSKQCFGCIVLLPYDADCFYQMYKLLVLCVGHRMASKNSNDACVGSRCNRDVHVVFEFRPGLPVGIRVGVTLVPAGHSMTRPRARSQTLRIDRIADHGCTWWGTSAWGAGFAGNSSAWPTVDV